MRKRRRKLVAGSVLSVEVVARKLGPAFLDLSLQSVRDGLDEQEMQLLVAIGIKFDTSNSILRN
ncbi:MAG: hypothetical protein A2534_04790 [Candidatus Magasanikbacteria bacterium RIFOXYD2_FULL_39_9]|uniref:Uncharacterized protein n=1 Tax=Candidatus Magasanikbacteria bacterium RIFOXYD1_FULL_40_23 TaxID=1798705 RepID=A0A1F6P8R5_9BACT|nr:MAG: hypothetical protein A2534_04790 [Candidatus Magasanikbacteria bacterium RIFOXYD2_FULL_39_9]OGH92363.1 MAG: hypothetical protein A2563_05270 [Candidatus Magasanikbacteria bacterium RIFOXYD1_FULL_40_23]